MSDRKYSDVIEVTLTLDTSAYASGDLLADTQALPNACRAGRCCHITGITLLDKDDQGQAIDLYFLRSLTSLGTENAAFEPDDDAAEEILTKIVVESGDYDDLTNSQVAFKNPPDDYMVMPLTPTEGADLGIAAVCRGGTPTYTASGIVVKVGILKD